jgi:glutamate--cysteine ligase
VGIFYEQEALDAAWDMVKDWSTEEHQHLRDQVPKQGLCTQFRNQKVRDLALQMLDISRLGLEKRNVRGKCGKDETMFLEPLQIIADTATSPAERKLGKYHSVWNQDLTRLFEIFKY